MTVPVVPVISGSILSLFLVTMIICPKCHSEIYDIGAGGDESV